MSDSMLGRLLVVEGPDFVGRTTHVSLLSERLQAHGVAVLVLGLARSALLGPLIKREESQIQEFGGHTRALLYATDLHHQVEQTARPALSAGYVVIADRYYYSPIIRELVRKFNKSWLEGLYAGIPQPTRTVILEASPQRQLDRLLRDSGVGKLNRYEAGWDLRFSRSPTTSFLKYQRRLAREFRTLADKEGIPVINTERPIQEVHEDLWRIFSEAVRDLLQPLSVPGGGGLAPTARK